MSQALKVQLWTDQVSWYLNLNLLLIMYVYLLKKNMENSSQVDWIIASIKKKNSAWAMLNQVSIL